MVPMRQHLEVRPAMAGPKGQKAEAEGTGTFVKVTGGRDPHQITRGSRTQRGVIALVGAQVRRCVVDAAQAHVVAEA